MEGWTLVLLLLGATFEERRYTGFATQDECLRNAPLSGPSVANWGTLTLTEEQSPTVTAVCVPSSSLDCPPNADLDRNGAVNDADFKLFLAAFERGTP